MKSNRDIIKHKIDSHEQIPSDQLWIRIEQTLDKPKRRPVFFWIWFPLSMLTLIGGFYLGHYGNLFTNSAVNQPMNFVEETDDKNSVKLKNSDSMQEFWDEEDLVKSNKDSIVILNNENVLMYEVCEKVTVLKNKIKDNKEHNSRSPERTKSNKSQSKGKIVEEFQEPTSQVQNEKVSRGIDKLNNSFGEVVDEFVVDEILIVEDKEKNKRKIKPNVQDSINEPELEKAKFYITPFIGTNYYGSFQKATLFGSYFPAENTSSFGSGYGVSVRYMINNRVGVRANFSMSHTVHKSSLSYINYIDFMLPNITNLNFDESFDFESFKNQFEESGQLNAKQKMRLLHFDTEGYFVIKSFNSHQLSVSIGGGVTTLNQQNVELQLNGFESFSARNSLLKKSFMSFNTNLFYNYILTERFDIEASTGIRYFMGSYNFTTDFKPYLWYLNLGLSYKL